MWLGYVTEHIHLSQKIVWAALCSIDTETGISAILLMCMDFYLILLGQKFSWILLFMSCVNCSKSV